MKSKEEAKKIIKDTLRSHMQKRVEKSLFQTFIDKSLYKKIVTKLKREKISRRSFIEGSIAKFLNEN